MKSIIYLNRTIVAMNAHDGVRVYHGTDHVLTVYGARVSDISINRLAEYVFENEAFLRVRLPSEEVPGLTLNHRLAKGA